MLCTKINKNCANIHPKTTLKSMLQCGSILDPTWLDFGAGETPSHLDWRPGKPPVILTGGRGGPSHLDWGPGRPRVILTGGRGDPQST